MKKSQIEIKLPITLSIEDLVNYIGTHNSDNTEQDLLELIVAINESSETWDFTEALIRHFKQVEIDYLTSTDYRPDLTPMLLKDQLKKE